jgi:hypothetical protein
LETGLGIALSKGPKKVDVSHSQLRLKTNTVSKTWCSFEYQLMDSSTNPEIPRIIKGLYILIAITALI